MHWGVNLDAYWSTEANADPYPAGVTLERLLELRDLEADVAETRYLEQAIAVNHGTNDPKAIDKVQRRRAPKVEIPTTGLLAIPSLLEPEGSETTS